MIPLGIAGVGLGIVGAGLSIAGSFKANAAQKQIAQDEQAIEAQKMKAMELDAKRRQINILRDQQRGQAMGLAAATNQGAQSAGTAGSGYYGGQAQVAGQSNFNLEGVAQNLQIGKDIFGLNAQISQQKMNLADAQTLSSIGSGLSGLGGSMISGMEKFDNIFKTLGGGNQGGSNQGGFGYGGYKGIY